MIDIVEVFRDLEIRNPTHVSRLLLKDLLEITVVPKIQATSRGRKRDYILSLPTDSSREQTKRRVSLRGEDCYMSREEQRVTTDHCGRLLDTMVKCENPRIEWFTSVDELAGMSSLMV